MRGEQVAPDRRLPAPILTRRSPVKRRLITILSTAGLLAVMSQPAFAGVANLGF